MASALGREAQMAIRCCAALVRLDAPRMFTYAIWLAMKSQFDQIPERLEYFGRALR